MSSLDGEAQAYLATCDRSAQRVIADTNFFVDNTIGEVITPSCHGTDKDGNRPVVWDSGQIVCDFHGRCIPRESYATPKSALYTRSERFLHANFVCVHW